MKKQTQLLTIALAALVFVVGCGKKESRQVGNNSPVVPAGPTPTPTPGGGNTTPPDLSGGATADLNFDTSKFEYYTGRLPNSPTNFKININMNEVAPNSNDPMPGKAYGGGVKIVYLENGAYYTGQFTSGTTRSEVRFNRYTNNGQKFKAFFDDSLGGLIVVVDSVGEFGEWAGKVFAKNYACGRNWYDPPCNPVRPRRCWLVSAGPYDCTAFKIGGTMTDPYQSYSTIWKVNMTSRTYPEDYVQLGTFSGMDANKALNIIEEE